ncbi:MAG TPA: hypothetical protein PKZ74_04155 [Bacteroidales bacterium]|nr:hypothetical protein [Bacteroidales bacterium]
MEKLQKMKFAIEESVKIRQNQCHPCSVSGTQIKTDATNLHGWLRLWPVLVFISLTVNVSSQQSERNWRLNGHLQSLQSFWIPPESDRWQSMTVIGNRFDFRWNPGNTISFHAGARNSLNVGQMVQTFYPYYAKMSVTEDGFFDLTRLWVSDTSYYFYSNIDRANIKIRKGKFEATIGRQRINWAINMVWTPNDIFNTFNYFDFDYIERPGCDAILLEYFMNETSSVQFGFKMDDEQDITSAIMYRFNRWNYDFQAFAGVMTTDIVAGAGWSGDIKGAGFTGEISYFHPRESLEDTSGILVGSVSANYTFRNSLFINASYLFNSDGTTGPAGYGNALALYADISAKKFTLAKHSVYAGIGYPVTPLIRADISAIYNPNDKSGFAGPSVDISLSNNVTFFIIGQVFWGKDMTEFGDFGSLCYTRLKWNF